MEGANAGHPALALDVFQQRTVEILSLAASHRFDIADDDEQLLRA
jgi:hypothetical protein